MSRRAAARAHNRGRAVTQAYSKPLHRLSDAKISISGRPTASSSVQREHRMSSAAKPRRRPHGRAKPKRAARIAAPPRLHRRGLGPADRGLRHRRDVLPDLDLAVGQLLRLADRRGPGAGAGRRDRAGDRFLIGRARRIGWLSFILVAAAALLSLVNVFVHSRDAWTSVVPKASRCPSIVTSCSWSSRPSRLARDRVAAPNGRPRMTRIAARAAGAARARRARRLRAAGRRSRAAIRAQPLPARTAAISCCRR